MRYAAIFTPVYHLKHTKFFKKPYTPVIYYRTLLYVFMLK